MKNLIFRNSKGFTLLEMMIAITILAVLTVLTSTSIRSGVQSRTKFQTIIEQDSQVREALKVIEKDINLAFHHRDLSTDMMNEINKELYKPAVTPTPAPGQPLPTVTPQNFAAPTPKPKDPLKELTAFVGDEKSLYFTSLSNVRLQRDEQSSDQAKIGYFLKNCKSIDSRGHSTSSNCLWRRVSPTLDDHIDIADANVIERVLIENVVEFKLKYFGPLHDEWQNDWKTTDNDAGKKNNFPYAVEVYLKVQNKNNPKAKAVEMRTIASLHFPNNNEQKNDPAAGANTNGGQPTPAPRTTPKLGP
jgi:prepilin-type N-terminal cleavage/methylation domain-containing protein